MAVTLPTLRRADPRIAVGLAGLALATALRLAVAGGAGAASVVAGVVFSLAVAVVAAATRRRAVPRSAASVTRAMLLGLAGGAVLCLPALARHLLSTAPAVSAHGYLPWALGVVAVAVAEEALLRGSLFAAVAQRAGNVAAVALTSVAFALLHVPLYGWAVVPLDLAVGVWLGVLRVAAGSVAAPMTAHAVADLVGWWLR